MAELKFQIGDKVVVNGWMYLSANGTLTKQLVSNKVGTITRIAEKGAHPYAIDNVYGWYNEPALKKYTEISVKVGDYVKLIRNITYGGKKFTPSYTVYQLLELDGEKASLGLNGKVSVVVNAYNLIKA